jgi:hypothetical protein
VVHARKLLGLVLPALVACGDNASVWATSDFGSGSASGGTSTSAASATDPSGDTVETSGFSTGSGTSTGSADTSSGGTDSGETEAASGERTSTESSADDGTDTTSDDTGSSTGDTTDSTTGNPVGVDACGFPEDGPWVEIEYNQAGASAQSPSWTFSNTPGWGSAQWAMQGDTWPETWDVWQNINVAGDPIGVLALVGPGAELQLMIGLEELVDYDHATVCVEGRSASATASVLFAVYNPLNDCGVTNISMAHDWVMHAEGIDLGSCLVPGGGVQAVRLEPTGGSSALGVKRMRVTLHGAVY